MSPLAPLQTDSRQASPSTVAHRPRGGRPRLIASVGVAATIALMGSLAACGPAEDNGGVASAKAESTAPQASGPAKQDTDGKNATTAPEDDADGSDTGGGNADHVAKTLLAHLKATAHGGVVTEVRVVKSYDSYEVTVNTSLPADSEHTDKALDRMDKGNKLATEAAQWLQDESTLAISSIDVLDAEKGSAGIQNGADEDKNKDAADKYGAELKAHLKTVAGGAVVTEVRLAKTYDSYEVSVNTSLPADNKDTDKALDRMDKGNKLATEAKQWVENHPSVKISSIDVLDKEKGTAGIENIG